MKNKLTAISFTLVIALNTSYTSADEYTADYNCAMEAYTEGFSGPVSYCIGNAYDPSPETLKAYADAKRDFEAGKSGLQKSCDFSFGIWMATGSRADGFAEGAQPINTLTEAAGIITSGRSVYFYNDQGIKISDKEASLWFVRKGDTIAVSDEAAGTCPDKV